MIAQQVSRVRNAAAFTVEGVTFQEIVSIDNKQIPIRGAALLELRWLKIFNVCEAVLNLPENAAPDDVLTDTPYRLEISYLLSLYPDQILAKGQKRSWNVISAPTFLLTCEAAWTNSMRCIDMQCSWQGDTGTLDEHFTYTDGKKERRVWRIKKQNDRYIGTTADVVGEDAGAAAGNA